MLPASPRLAAARRGVELADIFRAHGESYRRAHPLPVSHLKIMQAVERCTAALGGHLEQCDSCGYERPAYNSCRNRHCPKCQSLGGQIGLITVLHTWEQTLLDHFHLHCLVPAGVLSFDQKHWRRARQNFLFPVKALSLVFRGKFLDLLKKAFARNKLLFVGQTASLADSVAFNLLIDA